MARHETQSGFALLITLIVVGVVVSVGITILDLTVKQMQLSTNAKDSEIAFHAANAGMECARFTRRDNSDDMENGDTISVDCFGIGPTAVDPGLPILSSADGDVYEYDYDITWSAGLDQRCTRVVTLIASTTIDGGGITINNVPSFVPGFPEADKTCEAGARCTIISVRGYNRPCGSTGNFGTVEREVLLQY